MMFSNSVIVMLASVGPNGEPTGMHRSPEPYEF